MLVSRNAGAVSASAHVFNIAGGIFGMGSAVMLVLLVGWRGSGGTVVLDSGVGDVAVGAGVALGGVAVVFVTGTVVVASARTPTFGLAAGMFLGAVLPEVSRLGMADGVAASERNAGCPAVRAVVGVVLVGAAM